MQSRAAFAVTALLLSAVALAQGGGHPGGHQKGKSGVPGDACGAEIRVVMPNGKAKTYRPPEDFFKQYPSQEIDQGEQPRPALKVSELLGLLNAGDLEVMGCNNVKHQFYGHFPDAGPMYIVLTGRGVLKVVEERRPGLYAGVVMPIKQLVFHPAPKAGMKK